MFIYPSIESLRKSICTVLLSVCQYENGLTEFQFVGKTLWKYIAFPLLCLSNEKLSLMAICPGKAI